ncbi:hypothetical protein VAT7223_03469 [Vibrio atlanticus]|uniref:Uncharacterized protein n=1 Tax=Vibrio atlanticus TaxID=693153 RepID=A0A1C3J013_9VIBR|nr:hypothetical protein VAT7223_03469 [Vibrio atlanticus]
MSTLLNCFANITLRLSVTIMRSSMAICIGLLGRCSFVKQSNKVGHNGFAVTVITTTDYRFLVVTDTALNANNAPLLTGYNVSSKSGYLFTISW